VQPALVGVMTPIMQVQIPFCSFKGAYKEEGEVYHLKMVESTIIKIRVPTYFWQRSWRSHETEIGGKLGSIIVTRFF